MPSPLAAVRSPFRTRSLVLAFGACWFLAGCAAGRAEEAAPSDPAIAAAVQPFVGKDVAGAVSVVVSRDRVLHLGAIGQADVAAGKPMPVDALFWIASMTKPIAACAILMLQDEGRLSVDDPVAKYLPELADVATADGTPGKLTLRHLLTHTSGLAEASNEQRAAAHLLADVIPHSGKKPLQFAPGTKWQYCQSGINALGRIVEVVSGQTFDRFLAQRLFVPLGMVDTGFYPDEAQRARLATTYKLVDGALVPGGLPRDYDPAIAGRYPAPNGGLFSTASDYARFCRMLLGQGTLDRKRYLSPQAVAQMATVATGELGTGFTPGNGWGLGVCVVRQPQGASEALSPGSFGHGGAFGTQAWIDPVKGVAYILMVQRANFPNADASDLRRAFQGAAAKLSP